MEWVKDHEFIGTEFDWVAVDANGHLAYLSSAGFGMLPAPALPFGEQMYEVCDRVEALPRTTEIVLVSQRRGHEEWEANARRGFFTYDWNHDKGRYELIARPLLPLLLSDLDDPMIREAATASRIEGNFDDLVEIVG